MWSLFVAKQRLWMSMVSNGRMRVRVSEEQHPRERQRSNDIHRYERNQNGKPYHATQWHFAEEKEVRSE